MKDITFEYLDHVSARSVDDLNALMAQLTGSPEHLTVARVQEILDAGTKIIVAVADGRIVGTASVVVMKQLRWDKSWLEDIVVDEAYRGRGIARKLMAMGIEYSRSKGYKTLNMTSKNERESVWKMYESVGFYQRDAVVFRLDNDKA